MLYKKPKGKNSFSMGLPMWVIAVGVLSAYFMLVEGKFVEISGTVD